MKPVDLYVRVSRVGGRENLISPAEQERRGRALAAERGLAVAEVLTDLDESGGKLERPGLQEALRRVEVGLTGGVIVAWLDRLSRDSEHAHALVRRITDAGGAIYAPDAPVDWTTPEGELQAGIVFAFASYVRSRARAGFERAKQRAIENGIPVNNRAAVGYRKGADRRLELDPDTAPVVRRVFEARVGGAGPTELAQILEDAGVATSQGSRIWSREAVYGLLRNRVYVGELSYGLDRRFVNVAAHEPIVDLATWELAQREIASSGGHVRANLLAGLLRCSGCRHALSGTRHTRGHRIYRCKQRHAGGRCPRPVQVRADRVEPVLLDDLFAHLPKINARARRDRTGRLAELAAAAERERVALAQFASPTVQAEIGDLGIYASGLRERRERVEAAEAALRAEQRLREAAHDLPALVTWEHAWERMTLDERAGLLATRYDCIQLRRNPDLLIVYPVGTGPVDLPRRGFRRDPVVRGFDLDLPGGARVLAF